MRPWTLGPRDLGACCGVGEMLPLAQRPGVVGGQLRRDRGDDVQEAGALAVATGDGVGGDRVVLLRQGRGGRVGVGGEPHRLGRGLLRAGPGEHPGQRGLDRYLGFAELEVRLGEVDVVRGGATGHRDVEQLACRRCRVDERMCGVDGHARCTVVA